MRPRLCRAILLSGWVLMQKPADWDDPTDPPIEKWRRVKRFASEQDCMTYRNE